MKGDSPERQHEHREPDERGQQRDPTERRRVGHRLEVRRGEHRVRGVGVEEHARQIDSDLSVGASRMSPDGVRVADEHDLAPRPSPGSILPFEHVERRDLLGRVRQRRRSSSAIMLVGVVGRDEATHRLHAVRRGRSAARSRRAAAMTAAIDSAGTNSPSMSKTSGTAAHDAVGRVLRHLHVPDRRRAVGEGRVRRRSPCPASTSEDPTSVGAVSAVSRRARRCRRVRWPSANASSPCRDRCPTASAER